MVGVVARPHDPVGAEHVPGRGDLALAGEARGEPAVAAHVLAGREREDLLGGEPQLAHPAGVAHLLVVASPRWRAAAGTRTQPCSVMHELQAREALEHAAEHQVHERALGVPARSRRSGTAPAVAWRP